MALRILTGMLFINGGPKNGRAVISHSPFRLVSAASTVSLRKARVIGADGVFTTTPAVMVSARQFAILDVSPDTDYRLRINDSVTTTALTISWAGTGPIFNEEIPFIVVGEVGERFTVGIPGASPRPRRPARKARRPKKARAARKARRPKGTRRPKKRRGSRKTRRSPGPRPRKPSRARRRPARRPAARRRRR
jgi:hypothetical protein